MPFTLNGVGTWYYGRRNVFQRRDNCESCRAFTTLTSYDAGKYFVVLYVPLIPLAKVRVVDDCAACRKHRVVSLRVWETARQEETTRTATAQQSNPTDVTAAQAALAAAVMYQHWDAFQAAANLAEEHLSHHAPTLALVGEGFMRFSRFEDAARALALSLEAADDLQVREMLAFALIRMGKSEEAVPWVEHVMTNKQADRIGIVYATVEGLQSAGRHQDAMAVLDQCEAAMPQVARQKPFKQYRKTAKRYLNKDRKVATALTAPMQPSPKSSSSFGWKAATWTGPVIAMLALIAYIVVVTAIGRSREVYVVNGTDTAYSVTIAGQPMTLGPFARQRIKIGEGDVAMQISGTTLPVTDVTVHVSTPFWSRPFTDRTFVLNPDQSAAILWEQTSYAQNPTGAHDRYSLHVGQALHEFSGVDFEFVPFPKEVQLSSKRSYELRQRIDDESQMPLAQLYSVVSHEVSPQSALEVLKNRARFGSVSDELWRLIESLMPADELAAFVAPALEKRPLLMHWHRAHQVAHRQNDADGQLVRTYQALLDQSPNDPNLIYLVARLEKDPTKQEMEFHRALEAGLKSERVLRWLMYAMLSTGRFERALEYATRFSSEYPDALDIHTDVIESLMALGRASDAKVRNTALRRRFPNDGELALEAVMIHDILREQDAAQRIIDEFVGRVARTEDHQSAKIWREYMTAHDLYFRGDSAGFSKQILESDQSPQLRFAALVSSGQLHSAAQLLDESNGPTLLTEWMILHIAAAQARDTALAERALQSAVELLLQPRSRMPAP